MYKKNWHEIAFLPLTDRGEVNALAEFPASFFYVLPKDLELDLTFLTNDIFFLSILFAEKGCDRIGNSSNRKKKYIYIH